MPTMPPSCPMTKTSARNWVRMAAPVAPKLLRVPISLVLSLTETSMMFISPMPAPNKVINPMKTAAMVMPSVASSRVSTRRLLCRIKKELGLPGASPLTTRIQPVACSTASGMSSVWATVQVKL